MKKRAEIFCSQYLSVFHDLVEVYAHVEKNYYLTKKPDIVVVVAITDDNEVLLLEEYKYAAEKYMLVLPAGHIEEGQSIEMNAARELVEETGYVGIDVQFLGRIYESPVQDLHKVMVVKITGAKFIKNHEREEGEDIKKVITISKKVLIQKIKKKEIQSASTLAALTVSGVLFE